MLRTEPGTRSTLSGSHKAWKTRPCNVSSHDALLPENPSRHNAFKSRQHVSCRIPRSSCFLSATAGSAANIPETPIGPHPGRARGGAQPLIGRPLSMKRPRRFLRGTAALVCAGASEAKGAAGGQRAPGAGPGTCGAAGAGLRAPISPRPRQTSRRLRNQPGSLA